MRTAGFLGAVLVALVLARSTIPGVRADRFAMYALGGRYAQWDAAAHVLSCLPVVAGLAGLFVAVRVVVMQDIRTVAALVVLGAANLGTTVLKWCGTHLLGPGLATLPSGHATLALTSAVVLVMCRPLGRHDDVVGGIAAFGATVGSVGVVAAYWHRPGDVLASCLLVVLCLLGVEALADTHRRRAESVSGPWYVGRHRNRSHRPGGVPYVGRHRRCAQMTAMTPQPLAVGAATAVVTTLGWGFGPQTTSLGAWLLGMADLVLLPAAAVAVVWSAERVAARVSRSTH